MIYRQITLQSARLIHNTLRRLVVFVDCLHAALSASLACVSSPSPGHHSWPVSHLCLVWLSGGGGGGGRGRGGRQEKGGGGVGGEGEGEEEAAAVRPLHVFPIPPCRPSLSSPVASSCPAIPPLFSSFSSSSSQFVSLSACRPNCPLDFLFVYLLACLSVVWQRAKSPPPLLPITPRDTAADILRCVAASGSAARVHSHCNIIVTYASMNAD